MWLWIYILLREENFVLEGKSEQSRNIVGFTTREIRNDGIFHILPIKVKLSEARHEVHSIPYLTSVNFTLVKIIKVN